MSICRSNWLLLCFLSHFVYLLSLSRLFLRIHFCSSDADRDWGSLSKAGYDNMQPRYPMDQHVPVQLVSAYRLGGCRWALQREAFVMSRSLSICSPRDRLKNSVWAGFVWWEVSYSWLKITSWIKAVGIWVFLVLGGTLAGCQRSGSGINRILRWSALGQMYDKLVTGDGLVTVWWRFGDGLVMVWWWLKLDILAFFHKQMEKICFCDGVTVFFQFSPRACACVRACVRAYIKYDKNRHTVTLSVNYEYFQN